MRIFLGSSAVALLIITIQEVFPVRVRDIVARRVQLARGTAQPLKIPLRNGLGQPAQEQGGFIEIDDVALESPVLAAQQDILQVEIVVVDTLAMQPLDSLRRGTQNCRLIKAKYKTTAQGLPKIARAGQLAGYEPAPIKRTPKGLDECATRLNGGNATRVAADDRTSLLETTDRH